MSAPERLPDESFSRLAAEVAATTLFWGLWLYVITPLVSLLLWFMGVQIFVEQMITLGGYESFLDKLLQYGVVVLGIIAVTFSWVSWNLRHYGAHDHRTHQPSDVTLEETAAMAGLKPEALQKLQQQRRVIINFDRRDRVHIVKGSLRRKRPRIIGRVL